MNDQEKFFFSVIIPFNKFNIYLEENLNSFLIQEFKNFEIILVGNENLNKFNNFKKKLNLNYIKVKYRNPTKKRNLAISKAKGKYIVFIDDDAYSEKNWLADYYNQIKKNNYIVLGGPSLTPTSDSFIAKLSSLFYELKIGGGAPERYTKNNKKDIVDDWPMVNLIIEKRFLNQIGNLDDSIWPGEDTELCSRIQKNNQNIKYIKDAFVYHHRRGSIMSHLRQIFNYGYNRTHLIKTKKIKMDIKYFIPIIFLFYNLLLIKLHTVGIFFILPIVIYFLMIILESLKFFKNKNNFFKIIFLPLLTYFSHLTYGLGEIMGLIQKKYKLHKR